MVGYIYSLNDELGAPIYVGSTVCPLPTRLSSHKTYIKTSNNPVYRYIRGNNVKISINLIEEVVVENTDELEAKEYQWIADISNEGVQLYNHKGNPNPYYPEYAFIEEVTGLVRVSTKIYKKVKVAAKKLGISIGEYFTIAAEEKLLLSKTKK